MKVVLINPPGYANQEFIREGRCMQAASSWGSLWMPLSLAYTAAFLRKAGHQVKLVDCQAEKLSLESLMNVIDRFNPSLTVINTGFPSITGDMQTATAIKNRMPNIKVIAIGMFPTLLKGKMLSEYESIDCAVVGEPEWVVKNFADAVATNLPFENIQGLVFRCADQIKENPPQCFDKNKIDELPFPSRDLLNNDAYRHVSGDMFTHINIARGCPHNCSFCAAHYYYGHGFRKRQVESVIAELEECVNKYGIRKFVFWSESFTIDRGYGILIADGIINSGLKITWYTRSRVDNLDFELLQKMKKAGCRGISLGIESIDNEVLRRCRKQINEEQINDAIHMARRVGLNVVGHFVFGLPGDDKESAAKSIKFACDSGLDFAQFYCAVPYPDTELWNTAIENDWITSYDYSRYHLADSVMRNEVLSSDEIMELRSLAFSTFYNRPRTLVKAVSLAIKARSVVPHCNFIKWAKS